MGQGVFDGRSEHANTSNEINFVDLVRFLLKWKIVIAVSLAAGLTIGFYLQIRLKPKFRSELSIPWASTEPLSKQQFVRTSLALANAFGNDKYSQVFAETFSKQLMEEASQTGPIGDAAKRAQSYLVNFFSKSIKQEQQDNPGDIIKNGVAAYVKSTFPTTVRFSTEPPASFSAYFTLTDSNEYKFVFKVAETGLIQPMIKPMARALDAAIEAFNSEILPSANDDSNKKRYQKRIENLFKAKAEWTQRYNADLAATDSVYYSIDELVKKIETKKSLGNLQLDNLARVAKLQADTFDDSSLLDDKANHLIQRLARLKSSNAISEIEYDELLKKVNKYYSDIIDLRVKYFAEINSYRVMMRDLDTYLLESASLDKRLDFLPFPAIQRGEVFVISSLDHPVFVKKPLLGAGLGGIVFIFFAIAGIALFEFGRKVRIELLKTREKTSESAEV